MNGALALFLALFPFASARAFFGLGAEAKVTLLWMPHPGFSDWSALAEVMDRYADLRLTVGVAATQLPPEAARVLDPLVKAGRLELALRLAGDPILPLIAAHPVAPRPDDAPARLAVEREQFRVLFATAAAGFAPGAGAVAPGLFDGFRAMGAAWAATGEYAGSTSSWASSGGLALVPFRAAQTFGKELSAEDLGLPDASEPVARVIDEAGGLVPAGSLLRLLSGLATQRPDAAWATVRETLERRRAAMRPASAIKSWPSWTGGLETWTSGERSRRAWRLYGQAALAVERYQNSGTADLKALESATEELYAAQASRFYRDLPPAESEEAAKTHRSHLISAHRKIKVTPPDELYAETAGEETSTAVHVSQGEGWLSFDNPAGSLARAPAGVHLEDGTPAAALWKIERLRVELGDAGLTFSYKLGKLEAGPLADPPASAAPDMGRLLLETYIDLNHIAGAGSSTLLFDRGAFIQTRDAWEYALTISGWGAYLYRSNPLGSPIQAGKLSVSADAAQREVRVSVPRAMLRGNPLRWGFVVTASAADPATAVKPPLKPLRPAQGTAILGLLGPLDQQKTLMRGLETARPRLSAVRALQ